MKRRSFLAILTGIIAAPFVAKKAVAEPPAVKPYTVSVDWCRDSVPDRHSRSIVRVSPDGTTKVVYRFDRPPTSA